MSTYHSVTILKGFTLLECLTVVALLALFLLISGGFSATLFASYTARNEVHAAAHAFMLDAKRLRTLARTNKSTFSMVPFCNNTWESGWQVFENPAFTFTPENWQHVLWTRHIASQVTTVKPPNVLKTQGSQFADISLSAHSSPVCENASMPNERHQQLRHLSFNAVGSATTKNGGFTANRVIFWSRQFNTIEYQVILSDGGRLRLCQPSAVNPQCNLTY